MKNTILKNGEYKIEGYFGTVEDIAKTLPFCFNAENSDLEFSDVPYCPNLIAVTVKFGTGKGWNTTSEELKEIPYCSYDGYDF